MSEREPCQICGKIGGKVVTFDMLGGTMSRWVCPHPHDADPIAAQDAELIKRLRARAGFNPRKPNNLSLFGSIDNKLHYEAAARIAELSAEKNERNAACNAFCNDRNEERAKRIAAEADRDRLRPDAERYQWLRYRMNSQETLALPSGIALDRHIDAALAKGKP